jgi:GT2 family glycosyltransferase
LADIGLLQGWFLMADNDSTRLERAGQYFLQVSGDWMDTLETQPITIVVINFNGRRHLQECLLSVQEADGQVKEVILVDDSSTDGSVKFVETQFPWVGLIQLDQNQGPAAARNAGIEAAQTPWVCLLDNDVVVERGWLKALTEAMVEIPEATICSSRVLVYERPETIGNDGNEVHFVGMPTQRNAGSRLGDNLTLSPQEVGAVGGASCLIDRSRMGETAYFDPDFFYNFEELDFCLRNRMAGHKCLVVPQSIVHHKDLTGGVAELSASEPRYSSRRAYYVFRNRWFVLLKLYAARTLFVLAPALLLFEFVSFLFALRNKLLGSYLQAWMSVARALPSLMRKRQAIQASRVIPDRALLSAPQLTLGKGTAQSMFERQLASFLSSILEGYWALAQHLL